MFFSDYPVTFPDMSGNFPIGTEKLKSISNNRIAATRIDREPLRVGPRVGTYRVGYQEFGNTPGFTWDGL